VDQSSTEIYLMKIDKIQEFFSTTYDSECLFEVWNEDVLNAIAHFSFFDYDK
jgi:hypothetical protein